ncbi:hypothetical protein FQN54_009376 [Arachnomyces sp. PD_36]|nr:hypothetical protein FQN54_009376 [Arachnomyces sp. PD_36]
MPLFQARELLQFPNGDNSSDVLINNIHFNRTALNFFNYTLYDNGTLSNNSNCWLTFDMYQPKMLSNGTFLNGTSCYTPINGVASRGSAGIAFASMFAISIMFTLINLRKHGRTFLPTEKRWRAVGRRWQWYWMLFVAACGTVSCFMSIDVDRDYLQSTAIILQSFFYYLMLPGLLAGIWEGVRHWGSWQERQIYDRDSTAFPTDTTREKQEFYLPLIFYLFAFLNFFMTIPRSWSPIEQQRSLEQQNEKAKPSATDARFKASTILAVVCLFIICYGLEHSIYRYKPRPSSSLGSATFYLSAAPWKFIIVIILAAVRVGYGIAATFLWPISPLKYDGHAGWVYGLGYTPVLLIIIVLNIYGYRDHNEDSILIEQRAERGRNADEELNMGRFKKPSWWRRMRGDYNPATGADPDSRLKALASEIGGGRATQRNIERSVEMGNMNYLKDPEGNDGKPPAYTAESGWDKANLSNPFSDHTPGRDNLMRTQTESTSPTRKPSNTTSLISSSSRESAASQAKPQVIKSMLDV